MSAPLAAIHSPMLRALVERSDADGLTIARWSDGESMLVRYDSLVPGDETHDGQEECVVDVLAALVPGVRAAEGLVPGEAGVIRSDDPPSAVEAPGPDSRTLGLEERAEVHEIGPGMPREVFFGSELLRRWTAVWDRDGFTWLRHAQGAMLSIRWAGGEIGSYEVFEGPTALERERQWGWRLDPALGKRLMDALAPGAMVEAALESVLGRRHVRLRNLEVRFQPDGSQVRTYRMGALVGVEVEPSGAVRRAWFTEGPAAADLAALIDTTAFDAPPGVPGVQAARTWGEALLFVRTMQGRVVVGRIEQDQDPVQYTVVADGPEGRERFTFTIADARAPDPTDLGAGQSSLLDAADLVLVASTLEWQPRLAAAAVEQAERFIPTGAEVVPEAGFRTRASAWMRASDPERFTRARLRAEAARLRALAGAAS